ncbi:hypothetical protein AB0M43_39045 [Longispora sp. NPDC051575]|uniref:hypothetical protein n=1 Tax=Longispora sp. NPDC051575 TaxID=3154943 RepID=UPI00342A771C
MLRLTGYAVRAGRWDRDEDFVIGPFPTPDAARDWGRHAEDFGEVDFFLGVIELGDPFPITVPAVAVLRAVA